MSENRQVGIMWFCIGLLVVSVLGAVLMMLTKPKAARKPMSSMIPVVEVSPLVTESTVETVQCLGTVIAEDEAVLEAEVSGRITQLSPALVEGSLVQKGEQLLTIDPRDYELAVDRARAALLTAESNLRLEEGQQSVAQHEMELIGDGTEVDPAYRDLMLREPQLKSARANLKTAQADLASAQLDLDRTQIRAPFDGVVRSVDVSVGDQARVSKTLLTLTASSRFFVQGSLPIGSLAAFPEWGSTTYPATIKLAGETVREGILYKVLPDLSAKGRMARLLVAVKDPLNIKAGRPLLLDEVVRIELSGRPLDGVCRIARLHWRDGAVIWMIDDQNKLHVCSAPLVQGYENEVLVRVEFEPGWKLITSDIPAPVDGMPLRLQGQKSEAEDGPQAKSGERK